jgi:hypothetical protein
MPVKIKHSASTSTRTWTTIVWQIKKLVLVPKMAEFDERFAEAVREYPILYDKQSMAPVLLAPCCTVRFHLQDTACACAYACAFVASENQASVI